MVGTVLAWFTLELTGNFWVAFLIVPLIGFILGALIQRVVDSARPQRCGVVDRGNVRAIADPAGKRTSLPLERRRAASCRRSRAPFPLFGIDYEVYRLFAALIVIYLGLGGIFSYSCIGPSSALGCARYAMTATPRSPWAFPRNASDVLTFGIGFALAALGGVVAAPITTVEFRTGVDISAVLLHGRDHRRPRQSSRHRGGGGSACSFSEGIIQSFADPTVARISSLVLMSAVLLLRPQGLFKGLTK